MSIYIVEWINIHTQRKTCYNAKDKPCQYILLNGSMFIHKGKHIIIRRITKRWPRI